ncbi:MAG: ATP-binding protein [Kofleriaceae bacterium]|nr:ATP-binding protein [Kofleriaceae bacterium]
MARSSIRRRFVGGAVVATVLALLLFAVGAFAFVWIDDVDIMMDDGDTFREEAAELVFMAMAIATPFALAAAVFVAVRVSRRIARPLEDAVSAARETTAHDLRRQLPVPPRDDEVRDLVVALNELFVRLDTGFGALARFAADASHELRTPLAVLATELEVALRHPRTQAEWEAVGRIGLEELRRLSAIVEGLLTLARAGSDAPIARTRLRILDCIDPVIAQLASAADTAGIALTGPAESEAIIDGNPVMLETAVRNLVENALQSGARRIAVGVESDAAMATIVIDDDGPGLGANAEALFEPFRRGAAARADAAPRGPGVGLGLAIARRIATSHGGELTATASPLGGARFRLALPARYDQPVQ